MEDSCLKKEIFAYHAVREVAFLKNRISFYIVMGLISLAVLGLASSFISDPVAFFKNLFLFVIIGFGIFLLIRHFTRSSPYKREQQAFRKAAKRSKKRYQQKDVRKPSAKLNNNVSSFRRAKNKAKSAPHLTVIEGKKGKKKKRASF